MGRGNVETALQIPPKVRAAVDDRDDFHCRLCGENLGPERRVHHHVVFGGDARGTGGRRVHRVEEIVTLGWRCHEMAHRNKRVWLPLLLQAIATPGVTALQLRRWERASRA